MFVCLWVCVCVCEAADKYHTFLFQPASSSRMADKLAQSGELGRFVGFDSLAGGSSSLNHADGGLHDTHMHNEGAHFTTALRQLGKRDTTTKLKVCNNIICVCIDCVETL